MHRNLDAVSTGCQRIAELAKQSPQMGFTSLNHHIDLHWLHEAYLRTRKDGAAGVDGQTAADYEANLQENLQSLLDRAKSGTYKAPPVRRVHIPKGTGGDTRPIGIPTFEDKVLQRAVVMVLEAVYEQDFYDCSYGFRPGRSAHQALASLWQQTMQINGGWILDVDIQKFFDTLDHAHLRELLRRRVRDGVLLRLIGKWLNAGVLEDGNLSYPDAGTPQGGVISPLLSNVFLHYVLDEWFEQVVKLHRKGRAFLIRYADDFVMGFACEEDARRVLDVLPKRFGKYGLTLHPDKTRLVPFQRPPRRSARKGSAKGSPPQVIRPVGVHPLLESFPQGQLGGKAEDGQEPTHASATDGGSLVPDAPAPTDRGTTPDAAPEAQRALRVLRDHGQRLCVVHVPPRSDASLAQVAGPPTSTGRLPVATIHPALGALYAPAAGRGPLGVPNRSEPVT